MEQIKKPLRRHNAEKKLPETPWWVKHAQENPLQTAGALVTAFGSFILLAFFYQIGESPDFDLATFGAVPIFIAVVGFAVAALLTGCTFLAGLFHRVQSEDWKSWAWQHRKWTVILQPAPVLISLFFLMLYTGLFQEYAKPMDVISIFMWISFVLWVLILLVLALCLPKATKENSDKPGNWGRLDHIINIFLISYIWLISGYCACITFWVVSRYGFSNFDFAWRLFVWTVWCYALNIVVVRVEKNVFVLLMFNMMLGTPLLLVLTENWVAFPKTVVKVLGMGEIPVKLSVTEAGCEYLNRAAGNRVVCKMMSKDEKTATVCPAFIRSRIGSPFFIGLAAYDNEGHWPQSHPPKRWAAISIPKTDIPSWTQLNLPREKTSVVSTSSGVIVTYLDPSDQGTWLREECGASPDAPATKSASIPASPVETKQSH